MSPRPDVHPVEPVLTLQVFADDEGRLSAKIDSANDLPLEDAARIVAVIADQMDPARDRADEVGAWGAGRRKRV